MTALHTRLVHPEPVDGCYGCKLASVMFAPSVAGGEAATVKARERRWEKDMPAYKRLRQNRVQPRGIDGSATLEAKANSQFEVERGRLYEGRDRGKMREGLALSGRSDLA